MRRQTWTCDSIKTKFEVVTDQELKQILADVLEVLIPSPRQLNLQLQTVRPEMPKRLSKHLQGTRR